MLLKLLIAWSLMAVCVTIHAIGLAMAFRWMRGHPALNNDGRFWPPIRLLIDVAGWTILLHLVEISVWAFFYTLGHGMPDLPTAYYFSAVTYTTTGYGDLVLPPEWRLVGGVEALTGILMCGLSTGFFFTIVSRIHNLKATSPPD